MLADVGDLVEVKKKKDEFDEVFKGQGVVFGINPLNGLAQVHWIDEKCGLTIHWKREYLKVIWQNPLRALINKLGTVGQR